MRPDGSALAAEWLGVRHAVGTHCLARGPEAEGFLRRVPVQDTTGARVARTPRAGDVITIEPESGDSPSLIWGRTSSEWDLGYRPPTT